MGSVQCPHSQLFQSVLSVIIMLAGTCLCVSGISQFLGKCVAVDTTLLTDYVRRTATDTLNLSDLSQFR
jgi:hypothetical protein